MQLGGKCARCPETDIDKLEIDHINGRDWVLKDFSSHCRAARYKREAEEGKLQVLCGTCNKAKRFDNKEKKPETKSVEEVWNTEETYADSVQQGETV